MIVIVDYDNIPLLERNRGLVHLANRIGSAIGSVRLASEKVLRLRLYGGWFEGHNTARAAQTLVAAIGADLPMQLSITDSSGSAQVRCRAEMAYAPLFDPGTPVTHTYWQRSLPPTLRCVAPPLPSCVRPGSCPQHQLHEFFKNKQCSVGGCPVTPDTTLTRAEQKLVDSMMVTDLVHVALQKLDSLAVVSSDSDLLPGIRLALLHGADIVHIQTLAGRRIPAYYSHLVAGAYTAATL